MSTSTRKRPPPAHLWHHNAVKDECIRGHPFDAENTYVDGQGHRKCRKCRRLWQIGAL